MGHTCAAPLQHRSRVHWLNSSACVYTGGRSRPQSAAQEYIFVFVWIFSVSAYKSLGRSEVGSLELRGFQGGHVETDLHCVHGITATSVHSSEACHSLKACRQVCSASFTFLGLLTRRWHTLLLQRGIWGTRAPSRCNTVQGSTGSTRQLCVYTGGRSRPQSAAQEYLLGRNF